MIDSRLAKYLFSDVANAYESESLGPRRKIRRFFGVLKEAVNSALSGEASLFSTFFAKTVFFLDKFSFDKNLVRVTRKFRSLASEATYGNKKFTRRDVDLCFYATVKILERFEKLPDNIRAVLESDSFGVPEIEAESEIRNLAEIDLILKKFVQVRNYKNGNFFRSEFLVETEEFGEVELFIYSPWEEFTTYFRKGALVKAFDLRREERGRPTLATGPETLLALDPDYLYDATDLVECFTSKGPNPNIYFLNRFKSDLSSVHTAAGNAVNFFFDEMIVKGSIDFEETFADALRHSALTVFALTVENPANIKLIKNKTKILYENLKNIIPKLKIEKAYVEPSFISPKYGLQGRLDLLLTYETDEKKKDVIELKSGSAPSTEFYALDSSGARIKTGVWPNNLAQTSCYNMLLDSAFEGRTGSSLILYAADPTAPLRNAPNLFDQKRELMRLRNVIRAGEQALAEGFLSILNDLRDKRFGPRPSYMEAALKSFAGVVDSAEPVAKEYFGEYLSFVLRESQASKIGGDPERESFGFSALWREPIDDKEEKMRILAGLRLSSSRSDFEDMRLVFERKSAKSFGASLRKGDLAILYPLGESGEPLALKRQLLKCSVKEISPGEVKVSLRNKQFDADFFRKFSEWILEPDNLDVVNKKLINGLFQFLKSGKDKIDLLLGLRAPRFSGTEPPEILGLTDAQNRAVSGALRAEDYMLVQGPPGTGKTSYVLRNIVRSYLENTDATILVAAHTNRAVDEICSSIKNIDPEPEMVRLGSKESSEHSDRLISELVANEPLRDVFAKTKRARIIASTIASLLTNPDVFRIKKFDLAIVDEAAQLLEPHLIGVLSRVGKFVLIGDEKQLPAIVSQSPELCETRSENLKKIGLKVLSNSLFERLVDRAKALGAAEACVMLDRQARMHEGVRLFPSERFYSGNLNIFEGNERQTVPLELTANPEDELEEILSKNRMIFFDVAPEIRAKINYKEAFLAGMIIRKFKKFYGDRFDDSIVGAISPYRAQCAEIAASIPESWRATVRVDTPERFQGSEREFAVISLASNDGRLLKFAAEESVIGGIKVDRRLNVALTRAREGVIVIGTASSVESGSSLAALIDHIKSKGVFVDRSTVERIIETV